MADIQELRARVADLRAAAPQVAALAGAVDARVQLEERAEGLADSLAVDEEVVRRVVAVAWSAMAPALGHSPTIDAHRDLVEGAVCRVVESLARGATPSNPCDAEILALVIAGARANAPVIDVKRALLDAGRLVSSTLPR